MSKQKKERGEQGARPWRDTSVFAGGPGQKWTGYASWILLTVVVLVAAVVLFWPKPSPTSSSGPVPSSSSTGSSKDTGLCPEIPVDSETATPPADLTWTAVYGNSWPVSASSGPTKEVDKVGHCYARSPIGAALAAVNLTQTVRTSDIETAQKVLDTQYVQNEGVDIAAAGIAKAYQAQPPQTRQWGRTMGFKILSFSADKAQVLLVEYWPQRGQYTGFMVDVVWADGDWKVQLAPSGQTSTEPEITVDPNGYTPWAVAP